MCNKELLYLNRRYKLSVFITRGILEQTKKRHSMESTRKYHKSWSSREWGWAGK